MTVKAFNCDKIYLKKGAKDDKNKKDVSNLQEGLQKLGYYKKSSTGKALKVDGWYWKETCKAVKQFQKAAGGLKLDGEFGPYTCKKWSAKLGLTDGTKKTTTTKKTTKKATNKTVKNSKKKEVIIDINKYNIIPASEANMTIEGLHFRITAITEANTMKSKPWKIIELMNDKNKPYKQHRPSMTYDLTFFLSTEEYKKMKNGLKILMEKSSCKVISELVESGPYVVNIDRSYEMRNIRKFVMHLFEVT